ncbi:MAG: hypothetical protein OEZ06_28455 [Myxococcales bacterium]|nr:hypothetical protein [Myxococcales bacterium]
MNRFAALFGLVLVACSLGVSRGAAQAPEPSNADPSTDATDGTEAAAAQEAADEEADAAGVQPQDGAEADTGDGSEDQDEAWSEDPDDAVGWGQDPNDEAGFGGDDAVGFGDAGQGAAADDEADAPSPWSLSGFLRSREALWTERLQHNPLAKARQSADFELRYRQQFGALGVRALGAVHFEYDLAYQLDRERYDGATLEAYEWQVIGGESLLSLSYDVVEFTVGRQIVAWGQGEMLSPLDLVNPRDLREPGLAELDDVRMAVLASRAALFLGSHRVEAMVVHESYFGLWPGPGSDFSPMRALVLEAPDGSSPFAGAELRFEHVPDRFDPEASQFFGRYRYAGHGVDLDLYTANTLDRQGVPSLPPAEQLGAERVELSLYHPRYTMLGHAGALPAGDFLLRWELGVEVDRPLTVSDPTAAPIELAMIRRHQLHWMLGATYSALSDGSIGLEYGQSEVFDEPSASDGPSLLSPVEQPVFGIRYSQSFARQRAQATIAAMAFGLTRYRGFFARAEISYELRDAVKVALGYASYQPYSDEFGPLFGFDTHDRIFLSLRWDFALH